MAISSDVKLAIYNKALSEHIGERALAALTDAVEARRVLDVHWGSANEIVAYALERGDWNFAMRAVTSTYDAGIVPTFGYSRAHTKPDDVRRLNSMSSDDRFIHTLTHDEYSDEAGYWYCDHDTIFVRYVSDDANYGFSSDRWTEGFKEYLSVVLAFRACERITNSRVKKADLVGAVREALGNAKAVDTMGEGVKFPPHGSWVRSKVGGSRDRRNPY